MIKQVSALVILWIFAGCGSSEPEPSEIGNHNIKDTTIYCVGWDQHALGPYLVENNVWGQGNISNYSQCIYVTTDSSFGWNWDWPNQGYNVKSYPEVIYGRKPWSTASTHPSLPSRIENIETFTVTFDITMVAGGSYNLAFEFWVTADSMSGGSGITTEVMIWTDNNILLPAGNVLTTTTIDGTGYDLYYFDMENWSYYAFLSNSSIYTGTLNVHYFINYLIGSGYLDPSQYLASFEMGNEVVYGAGATDVHHYTIAINN